MCSSDLHQVGLRQNKQDYSEKQIINSVLRNEEGKESLATFYLEMCLSSMTWIWTSSNPKSECLVLWLGHFAVIYTSPKQVKDVNILIWLSMTMQGDGGSGSGDVWIWSLGSNPCKFLIVYVK